MTLQFYAFQKPYDQPSASGYCQKLETFFRATDFRDYEPHFTLPFRAPKGKLPYVVFEGQTIPDSHFIVQHLVKTKKVPDLDASLTPSQRAETRAWQAYVEELIYPAAVFSRLAHFDLVKEEYWLYREAGWTYEDLALGAFTHPVSCPGLVYTWDKQVLKFKIHSQNKGKLAEKAVGVNVS